MSNSKSGKVEAIATRPERKAPMVLRQCVSADPNTGLSEDAARKRETSQVSLLSAEKWAEVCAELGAEIPWTYRRANLLVSGLELDVRVGARLAVGETVLEVLMETDPCKRMDEQHAGLMRALEPGARGGVRCRIVEGGEISVGDSVRWL